MTSICSIPRRDTLYYDGHCPLCLREVRQLRRLQRGGLALMDIHQPDAAPGRPDRETLLRTLHLRTSCGRWLTGVDATVRAWSHTRLGWLLRPLAWPWLAPLARRVYGRWSRRRYERLYGCNVCRRGGE